MNHPKPIAPQPFLWLKARKQQGYSLSFTVEGDSITARACKDMGSHLVVVAEFEITLEKDNAQMLSVLEKLQQKTSKIIRKGKKEKPKHCRTKPIPKDDFLKDA